MRAHGVSLDFFWLLLAAALEVVMLSFEFVVPGAVVRFCCGWKLDVLFSALLSKFEVVSERGG